MCSVQFSFESNIIPRNLTVLSILRFDPSSLSLMLYLILLVNTTVVDLVVDNLNPHALHQFVISSRDFCICFVMKLMLLPDLETALSSANNDSSAFSTT